MIRIQNNESIMCGLYCIAFVEYMLAGKTLLDVSRDDYKKNDKMIYRYFKDKYGREASIDFRLKKLVKKEIIFQMK